ncbi:TRAP transporter substrate-binding protein DctP (plasmid) [Tistrella bauzanensis]|uniref:TRAP transporter substrate-binding protein DctP n=1 Tax=Tistrella TaxID=171436 RepID=UPI0031F6FD3D
MSSWTRRTTGAAAILTAAAMFQAITAGPAAADDTITLRVAHSYPVRHTGAQAMEYWGKLVDEQSNGRLKFEIYPAEQLAKSSDLLDAAINGIADITYAAPLYISDRLPLSTIAAVPLVGNETDPRAQVKAFSALALGTLNEVEFLPQGVRVIEAAVTYPYQLMTTKTRIERPDQLQGVKLRSSGGIQERSVEALGAIPVAIPAPDLYPALQRGTVDGSLFNVPTAGGYKLEEQLRYSTNNLNFGLFPTIYVINETVWQKLPTDLQDLLIKTGKEMDVFVDKLYGERAETFAADLEKRGGAVYDIAEADLPLWAERLQPVQAAWVKEFDGRGMPASRVYQEWEALLTR